MLYCNWNDEAWVPLNDAENGVSDSVSVIVTFTKSVPLVASFIFKSPLISLMDALGWLFANTFIVTLEFPTFEYWSVNDILDTIVSPLPVDEPLKASPIVKLPLESINTAGFDDVNDESACEPWFGEYDTLTCDAFPPPKPDTSLIVAPLLADSII